jgi:hypothetical protein
VKLMFDKSIEKLKIMDSKVVLDTTRSLANLSEWVNGLRKKQKPAKKTTEATEEQQESLVEPKGKKQKSDGPTDKPKQTKAKKDGVRKKQKKEAEVCKAQ